MAVGLVPGTREPVAGAPGLRVAIVSEVFLPKLDGIVNTLRHTLDGLIARDIPTLLVTPRGYDRAYRSIPIVQAPSLPIPLYPQIRVAWPDRGVAAALDSFAPDLVHVLGPTLLGVGVLGWAERRGRPAIATYHTHLPDYAAHYGLAPLAGPLRWWLRRAHNCCRATLCPSRPALRHLHDLGFNRLRIWGRGVDTARFSPGRRSAAIRATLSDGHPDVPLLLYAGRLAPEKGLEILAEVLPRLGRVRLALVGDGPSRADLTRRLAGLPVSFAGFWQGSDLAAAYASADIFVFPSATETFGNVVLEAMASGLPVVAAAAGGPRDLIDHRRDGLLYPPGDAGALTAALAALIASPALRQALGKAARRRAEGRTWDAQIDALVTEYRRALPRGATDPAWGEAVGNRQ